jgi:hypothetical protein
LLPLLVLTLGWVLVLLSMLVLVRVWMRRMLLVPVRVLALERALALGLAKVQLLWPMLVLRKRLMLLLRLMLRQLRMLLLRLMLRLCKVLPLWLLLLPLLLCALLPSLLVIWATFLRGLVLGITSLLPLKTKLGLLLRLDLGRRIKLGMLRLCCARLKRRQL